MDIVVDISFDYFRIWNKVTWLIFSFGWTSESDNIDEFSDSKVELKGYQADRQLNYTNSSIIMFLNKTEFPNVNSIADLKILSCSRSKIYSRDMHDSLDKSFKIDKRKSKSP